jgi:hypothetical protein
MTARKITTSIHRPAIDLRKRAFEGSKHGIVFIGTWLRDGNHTQPCLVLLHGLRPIARGRTIPCIIALDSAWKWAAHSGVGDPEHCGRLSSEWIADGLLPGNPHSAADKMAVLDVVNSRLSDLIAMPPAPKGERQVFGDIIITNRLTGDVTERSMIQDV